MKPLTEVRADLGGGVIVRRGTPLVDPVTCTKYTAACDPWPSWTVDGAPVVWLSLCDTGLPFAVAGAVLAVIAGVAVVAFVADVLS